MDKGIRMVIQRIIVVLLFVMVHVFAQDQDSSEKLTEKPVTIFSIGVNGGPAVVLHSDTTLVKIGISTFFHLRPAWDISFEGFWGAPEMTGGALVGVRTYLLDHDIRPFVGGAMGVSNIVLRHRSRANNLGLTLEVFTGVNFEISQTLQVVVKVPYSITYNRMRNQTIGVEMAFMFSDPFRKIRAIDVSKD